MALHPTGDKPATELGCSDADGAGDNPSHQLGDLAPNFEQDIRAWRSLNLSVAFEETRGFFWLPFTVHFPPGQGAVKLLTAFSAN